MANTPYPTDVLSQTQDTLEGWKQIDSNLKVGELTQAALAAKLTTAQTFDPRISALEAQLTDLRNQRDAAYSELWDGVKRVRSVVKGMYGDDSSQYEVIGGTRKSERKKPVRKAKAKA